MPCHKKEKRNEIHRLLVFNCRKEGRLYPITEVPLMFYFYHLDYGCHFLYLIELMTHHGLRLRKYPFHFLIDQEGDLVSFSKSCRVMSLRIKTLCNTTKCL